MDSGREEGRYVQSFLAFHSIILGMLIVFVLGLCSGACICIFYNLKIICIYFCIRIKSEVGGALTRSL